MYRRAEVQETLSSDSDYQSNLKTTFLDDKIKVRINIFRDVLFLKKEKEIFAEWESRSNKTTYRSIWINIKSC